MKCEKCGQKNIKKAYYCKKCGEPFTEKERKKAEYKGFIGFIKRIEKWYNTCTLKVITDSLIFKMLLIIFLLGIGIYNFAKTGNDLKINEDSSYQVTYNTKEKEYYVYMLENNNINKNGKLHLDLYIPNLVNELDITYYDENNNVLYEVKIPKEEEFEFIANTDKNNYYKIKTDNKEEIKVFVYYPKEVGEVNEK